MMIINFEKSSFEVLNLSYSDQFIHFVLIKKLLDIMISSIYLLFSNDWQE
jgi:hypothetical protein